jgi:hypothetical protein
MAVLTPAGALAAGTQLTGELLLYSNSQGIAPAPPLPTDIGAVDLSTDCGAPGGDGNFSYAASGNANGPLEGTFAASGSGTFIGGELTSLSVTFDVDAALSDAATGSLTLDPLGDPLFGTCSIRLFDWDDDGFDDVVTSVSAGGWVTYTADVTRNGSSTSEQGYAYWRVACFSVNAQPACDESETSSISFVGGSLPRTAEGIGSAATAAAATATDPVATSVDGPADSQIYIDESPFSYPWADEGFAILGREISISVYDADFNDVVTPEDAPIRLAFRVYLPVLSDLGIAPTDLVVRRDGEATGECPGATAAVPDPCISSRVTDGDQLILTVLTTHASVWSLGIPADSDAVYVMEGFTSPLGDGLNVVRAGQAVPLKWRLLSGNVPVLSIDSASITTVNYECGMAVTPTLAEKSPGRSALKHLGDGYYQLNWATPKSYANSCKELTLTLDVAGETVTKTVLFQFRK